MGVGLLAVPIAGVAYLQPRIGRTPIPLHVDEVGRQLLIRWEPQSEPLGLEIVDHGQQMEIPLEAGTSRVTYGYSGNDVQVRLVSAGRTGELTWNGARFVTPRVPVVESSVAKPGGGRPMEELEQEARRLRESVRENRAKIAELEERARRIVAKAR